MLCFWIVPWKNAGVSGLTETPRRAVAGTHSLCSVFSLVQLQAYLKLFGKN